MMQAAGIASRTGTVRIGQTLALFSACLGIGLMIGRTRPIKRTLTGAGAAAIVGALMLPTVALLAGTATAAAQAIQLTDEEVCDLTPATRSTDPGFPGPGGLWSPLAPVEAALAGCSSLGWFDYTGLYANFTVYLFASEEDALAQWQSEVMATNEWFSSWYESSTAGITDGYDPTVDYNAGGLNAFDVSGAWFSVMGVEDRVVMKAGPFMLLGVADNLGFTLGEVDADGAREPITLIEELITPMVEAVGNIEDFLAGESPPPDEVVPDSATLPDAGGTTPTDVTSVPPADQSVSPQGGDEGPGGTDEPIEPEEAAAQAIAGLIAAAAIGVISWTEAAGEIGDILGGRAPLPEPSDPFIDPYDQTPLQTDPDTGLVFWPWDGGDGHWVNPAQVPALLDEWNRELDAETARRVSRHDAQRDQNWQDLGDRIRRSAAAAAGRRAAEQARLDDFDRRVKAARTWMEEADAGSLGQLDRIMQRVADQGYATDEDLDRARRIADRARVWADTKQRWDADDWVRIERNKATVVEIAAKGAAISIDPTKGIASGFIFGTTESWQRGDSMATVVGNGVFDAAMFRGTHAIGTWAPGRAAMGKIGWGSFSGSLTAAGETLLRGGSLDDALHAAKIGFVAGGMGGIAEEAAGAGTRPAGQLPTIRTQRGGPQVGYDTPSQPSLRPPERGGVSWSDPSVPGIRVEPGGYRPHYDHPLSPRHIDPQDPRYAPPGTPAEEIHLPPSDWSRPPPQIDEMPGPLGGRPPSTPSPPPSAIEPGQIDLPEYQPPAAGLPEGRPPGIDIPDAAPPPTPGQLLEGARPTRASADILGDMMNQPSHPAGTGAVPDAPGPGGVLGGIDTDGTGRLLVNGRQIGEIDPATGTIRNLNNEPVRVAVDGYGRPVGYIEQPDVPPGLTPVHNQRGELVGHVDELGRAEIGGERVRVAIDGRGNLVPYDAPRSTGSPVEHLPPEGLRGQSRLPGGGEAATGAHAVPPAPAADLPPITGRVEAPPPGGAPIDYTPYGQPVLAGDNRPPIGLGDLDTGPRIPVLDESGRIAHVVEAGPREIHYDAHGNPHFVQRQYPVQPTSMPDIDLSTGKSFPGARQMPTPEVWDLTEASYPLTGTGAPPPAPEVLPPAPPGGDPP
jgi:hypothetical protein